MTNRRDLIDEALLRPGRLEVHMEIPIPNDTGRIEIFNIHTSKMRANDKLSEDVDIVEKAGGRGGDAGEEARFFRQALVWYQKAYDLRQDYYPGINLATLQFVLGKREEAKRVAEEVIECTKDVKDSLEISWVSATRAEANLLLGNCERAEQLYRQAADLLPQRDCLSMRRQAELIVHYAAEAVRAYWTPEKFDQVFGVFG